MLKYATNPISSTAVLKVKPIKCSRGSGLGAEESEEMGRGEQGTVQEGSNIPSSPSPQGHVLLQLPLLPYCTAIGLPSGFGVPLDISYAHAVTGRSVGMEGKRNVFSKPKPDFIFYSQVGLGGRCV